MFYGQVPHGTFAWIICKNAAGRTIFYSYLWYLFEATIFLKFPAILLGVCICICIFSSVFSLFFASSTRYCWLLKPYTWSIANFRTSSPSTTAGYSSQSSQASLGRTTSMPTTSRVPAAPMPTLLVRQVSSAPALLIARFSV